MSPLKFVTITELKQRATAIVAEVARSKKQVIVTKNGIPVAVISPAREEQFEYQEVSKKKAK